MVCKVCFKIRLSPATALYITTSVGSIHFLRFFVIPILSWKSVVTGVELLNTCAYTS